MLKQRDDESFEKLYKPEEAWTALTLSRPSFYRHVASGRLPVVRMGGVIRVRDSVLRAAIENGLPREKAAADMTSALHPESA
jgi:hypothetical protein